MLALWLDDDSRPIQLRGLPLAQHGVLISYTMFAGINDLEISASTDILPITSTLNFDAENSVSLCAETFLPYLHSSTVDFRLYLIPLAARKDPAIKVFDGQDSTTCSVSENQIHTNTLYPNPSYGVFKINSKSFSGLSVIDVLGKTVYKNPKIKNLSSINLKHVPAGFYQCVLSSEKEQHVQKIQILK